MKYEEFKQLRSEKKIRARISYLNAAKVRDLLPNRYRLANNFWAFAWLLSMLFFILISIFYSWKIGLPLLFILSPLMGSAIKKSCAQFVLEHAEEEKRFFDLLVENNFLIFQELPEKETKYLLDKTRPEILQLRVSMGGKFDAISNAMDLIIKYHGAQKRKAGGQPVIIHLLEVANLIYKGFPEATPELVAAGLCHDLLEDTECTEDEIIESCGDSVLQIVKNVSNDPNLDEKDKWEEKKLDYLKKVSEGSREAQIVCLCDKIANMRSLLEEYKVQREDLWKSFNRGKDRKSWFEGTCHEMLSEKLGQHRYLDLYAELIETLDEPEENGLFDNPYIKFEDEIPDKPGYYEIWLKNPDKVRYEVQMQTGGSVSCDEELLTIESEGIVELGKIDPEESILLESGHIFGISDSTVWFRLWLNDPENNKKLIKFSAGKGGFVI